jgi:hypothetical protein
MSSILTIFLSILSPLGFAKRGVDAAEALDAPPVTPSAQRYRGIAFCFFLVAAALLLTAGLVDCFADARLASEVFGWSGIGCLQICVTCGLRYKAVNRARLRARRIAIN